MHGVTSRSSGSTSRRGVGLPMWDRALVNAGLPGKVFMPFLEYPDDEALKLIEELVAITGSPASVILEDFGAFIAPDLLAMYKPLIDPEWRTLDVVEHTEGTVHTIVRSRNPGAAPPYLHVERTGEDEVVVHYTSKRRLCDIAKGIVRGLAAHYEEQVAIDEPECMNRGGRECLLVVRRA